MDDTLTIGKWLEFDAGTCFGDAKRHFGVILGIDHEQRIVVVAVNATSQVEKLIKFADLNGIPVEDAMVDVTGDLHFKRPTGLDCHRPQTRPLDIVRKWVEEGRIRKSSYNEDIGSDRLRSAVAIMMRSPLIPENIKEIIRNSNQTLI